MAISTLARSPPPVSCPLVGAIPLYEVFQHGSAFIGIGILSIWLAFRYRVTEPSSHALSNRISPVRRMLIGGCFFMVALVGGIVRATTAIGIPDGHPAEKRFVGLLVVTAIALVWWQLVGL
jgi:glycerol uptake facilitator-like aquaporin